jgi:hypothetical protein
MPENDSRCTYNPIQNIQAAWQVKLVSGQNRSLGNVGRNIPNNYMHVMFVRLGDTGLRGC